MKRQRVPHDLLCRNRYGIKEENNQDEPESGQGSSQGCTIPYRSDVELPEESGEEAKREGSETDVTAKEPPHPRKIKE